MRSLFGRRHEPDSPALLDAVAGVWETRLAALGTALDGLGVPLRDVAASFVGGEAWVSAAAWQATRYHTGWAPVAFRVVAGVAVPLDPAAAGLALLPVGGPPDLAWRPRLWAIGCSLDRLPAAPRDPALLDLDGRIAVTALMPAADGAWAPVTWTFAQADLRAAAATEAPR